MLRERNPQRKKTRSLRQSQAPTTYESPAVAESAPPPATAEEELVSADTPPSLEDQVSGVDLVPDYDSVSITLEQKEAKYDDKAKFTPAPTHPLRGVITDINGEPLIGATIIESGTTNAAISDFDGQFDMQLLQETTSVEVAYTGYQNTVTPVEGKNFVEIQMQEGVALDEVVVTSQGVKREKLSSNAMATGKSKKKRSKPAYIAASGKFKRFVKKNQRYPEAAKNNNIQGEVKVEFTIDSNGRPMNFKVIKSLGYGCDEEAIRLLKEGPDWERKSGPQGQNVKGRADFTFK